MYLVGFCAKTYKWKLQDILEAPLEFTLDMISIYAKVSNWQWEHVDKDTSDETDASENLVPMDKLGL